jgi:3-methyladenine DNA glycosylase AlkC
VAAQHPSFNSDAFLAAALDGYESLDLTPRAWQITRALHSHLPPDYPSAIGILLASLGAPLQSTEKFGMAPFLYLPHVFFVASYGADHFEESMHAQYELTQRFSAEFSIRVFLEKHERRTLARLRKWASDPSPHVRRLVSEGTRPRLPWAARLRAFQKDPAPVLELLELLKDDPELYVRRSVANNLNDIGKDHPRLLVQTCKRWLKGASEERRWLVSHALRSAIKRGDPGALAVSGFGDKARVAIENATILPARPKLGNSVTIEFDVRSLAAQRQNVLVDYRVHFVKANGGTSAKVFKLKSLDLARGERVRLSTKLSLRQMTTRQHFRGIHKVEALVNGKAMRVGSFEIT